MAEGQTKQRLPGHGKDFRFYTGEMVKSVTDKITQLADVELKR